MGTAPTWLGLLPMKAVMATCEPSGAQLIASTVQVLSPVVTWRRPVPSAFMTHRTGLAVLGPASEVNAIWRPSGDQAGRKFQSLSSRMRDWEVVSRFGAAFWRSV